MNKRKVYLFLLVSMISGLALAQPVDYMQRYNAAKANLEAGIYSQASQDFSALLNADPAHPVTPYTSFFYGVSTYHLGTLEKAKDIFLQILQNYSTWEKIDETYLWLSKLSFELSSPNQGIYYANLIRNDPKLLNSAFEIKHHYLSMLDILTLETLLEEHDNEAYLAELLTRKLIELPLTEHDNERIRSLIIHYQLDSTALGLSIPEDIFKDQYKVAVMLPLYADRLWESGIYLRKSLAVDLYEGIQMAMEEVDSTKIELVVFDTKKDSITTLNILQSGRLNDVDAVIGPLYPKPMALMSAYSYDNKLNFINPVTTNSEIIANNPYAFLAKTGAKSMGTLIAEKVVHQFDNKAFAIYYGPRKSDSIAAFNYSVRMEADSFYVAIRQQTETNKAREIFDSLTSSFDVVDSVELRRMWREREKVRVLPLKDSLRLKVDSLGHIFIASDNKAIASEVMSAITSRGDTTQLIGVGNWFSTANASLDIMEKLGVWLAMQEYENMLAPENIVLRERYVSKYHKKPGKYVFYGYYTMKIMIESLLNYGVYFQNGYKEQGNLHEWFKYSSSQDNQNLVIYKLQNGVPLKLDFQQLE